MKTLLGPHPDFFFWQKRTIKGKKQRKRREATKKEKEKKDKNGRSNVWEDAFIVFKIRTNGALGKSWNFLKQAGHEFMKVKLSYFEVCNFSRISYTKQTKFTFWDILH